MKKILIIVHQETSEPGLIGLLLRQQGYELDIRCPALGNCLPTTLEEHDGAIVFGGPMSANDDDTLPFIRAELDWISIALEAEKPYLGICLGAQMLARVLGATVAPHPDGIREIGYMPIEPVQNGKVNPLVGLTHVYHWHQEGFEMPQSATLLAAGAVFTNQAFRYGKAAYGVQFHPEITRDMIDLWTNKAAEQLVLPGAQDYDTQIEKHDRFRVSVEQWLQQFLSTWLNQG